LWGVKSRFSIHPSIVYSLLVGVAASGRRIDIAALETLRGRSGPRATQCGNSKHFINSEPPAGGGAAAAAAFGIPSKPYGNHELLLCSGFDKVGRRGWRDRDHQGGAKKGCWRRPRLATLCQGGERSQPLFHLPLHNEGLRKESIFCLPGNANAREISRSRRHRRGSIDTSVENPLAVNPLSSELLSHCGSGGPSAARAGTELAKSQV
jgi:hypothetical protein